MIDERQEEQACLYVLGILDPAEAADFENKLRSDSPLQQMVAEIRTASAAIPAALKPLMPPPALKQKIFSQLSAEKMALGVERIKASTNFPVSKINSANSSRLVWAGWLAAACLLVVAIFTYVGHNSLRERIHVAEQETLQARQSSERFRLALESARKQSDSSNLELQKLSQKLTELLRPGNLTGQRLIRLSAPPSEALPVALIMWDQQKQTGTILLDKLPSVLANQDYQLWIIDPSQKNPIDCGTIILGANGVTTVQFAPKSPVKLIGKFALTLEKKGGVPAPQGTMVLLGS